MKQYILAINPGSTTTKLGVFLENQLVESCSIKHSTDELNRFEHVIDQLEYRMDMILNFLDGKYEIDSFRAFVGRGGLLRPIPCGTYTVTEHMLRDLRESRDEHACNLGAPLAAIFAARANAKAYIVDPVVVDEMQDVARISGLPQLRRKSVFHALNIRAVFNRLADDRNLNANEISAIVAHMGGGTSLAAIKNGRIIDVVNALEEGSFTPERAGAVPMLQLIDMAYSGTYSKDELRKLLVGKGGLVAYFGTNDCKRVQDIAEGGDEKAKLVLDAMVYQISKQIGSLAAALEGNVDYIILTGGIARDQTLMESIRKRVAFIAPVEVFPGEDELQALNEGVLRVLSGKELAKTYEDELLTFV